MSDPGNTPVIHARLKDRPLRNYRPSTLGGNSAIVGKRLLEPPIGVGLGLEGLHIGGDASGILRPVDERERT